jgi:hypothetical protein
VRLARSPASSRRPRSHMVHLILLATVWSRPRARFGRRALRCRLPSSSQCNARKRARAPVSRARPRRQAAAQLPNPMLRVRPEGTFRHRPRPLQRHANR